MQPSQLSGSQYLDMRLYLAAIFLFLASVNATAGWFGLGGTSWQEEVLLHDGRKIIVERSVERHGRHEVGSLPAYTRQTLSFINLDSGKAMTWEDKATDDLGTSSFLPIALDTYQGIAYLVVTPMGCQSYNKWGRPNPPYVIFRHSGKTWERVPMNVLPQETKALNLIASSPDTEVERLGKRLVDAEAIKHLNAEFRQPEFKSILRAPLSKERIEQMCEERVLYKGYWILPNDPVARAIIDKRK